MNKNYRILFCQVPRHIDAKNSQKNVITSIVDIKDFKKLLRTKNNILTLFINYPKENLNVVKVFEDTAELIKGQGTMVLTDCSGEAKKLCKKLKVNPDPYVIKHYKDGDFHKNYDRKITMSSMLNFMRDPTGDIPWDEDSAATGIVHIPDPTSLTKLLRKEMGPLMIMFYAPWCGFCKQLKPEYAAAANELKGHSILAAIDVNKPENIAVRNKYNITGFPTLIYFENGVKMFNYEGENKKDGLVAFMKNPSSIPIKPVEVEWSESENDVEHLTDKTFEETVKSSKSILVMFYAPWCGHCKRLKPEYEKAAEKLKKIKSTAIMAALDATKETKTAKQFNVNGYPTMKYFENGDFQYDVNFREEKELLNFMKDPKMPLPPPPPEKPWAEEDSEVNHLTVETFKPFLRKRKHAIVMFYAPWCGHCKKAKPEYTAAADAFKDDSKVAFAAVDCTTQQAVCSAYNVKGYPTIKVFHYLNKEPVVDYTGGRTENDFISYMKKFSPKTNTEQILENNTIKSESKGEEKIIHKGTNEKESKEKNEKISKVRSEGGQDWSKFENSDLVLHISDSNFKKITKEHDFLLILFYKDGAKESGSLKKEYSLAALMVENRKLKGKLAACDALENKNIISARKINSYPTIHFYRKGVFHSAYTGKFIASDIFNYFKNFQSKLKDEL
ncbi:hypothetical protein RUM43_000703 [Polyplax serrata]|uniref:Thioredoxin domain-containing protein n=1 Tax=Polyplax serrata TaxID=468196 RepID=A0AAN8SEI6_POLSC